MSRARTSTFCWPTQAIICEMLMKEPLLPLVTILMMLLSQLRLFCAVLPARAQLPAATPHLHRHGPC
jgi:hypothetical protein